MYVQDFDPKALLEALIKNREYLNLEIGRHFAEEFSIFGDLDEAFGNYFKGTDLKGDKVGYVSSHLALMQLRIETEKAIRVLIESNDLGAYYDYLMFNRKNESLMSASTNGNNKLLFWILVFLVSILLTVGLLLMGR